MKQFYPFSLILALALFTANTSFAVVSAIPPAQVEIQNQMKEFGPQLQNLSVEDFLGMTPKKYKEMTGKKMGIKNALKLKAAQKFIKKQNKKSGESISSGLYVLLAIFGLGWLAMGLIGDWSGNDWIINLLLTLLCWLPGLIHALVKKDEYV